MICFSCWTALVMLMAQADNANFDNMNRTGNVKPYHQLAKYILKNHERDAPPDSVIEVDYEIELVHIVGIDEVKQRMTVVVYVVEEWNDPTLAWDPYDFNGINLTWVPFDLIWLPDIIVFNMLNYKKMLASSRAPVQLSHNGRVTHTYPALYSVMCIISIPLFPFDDQKCALEIASWGYSKEKLFLNVTHKERASHYSPNEEWGLKSVGIHRDFYEHDGNSISQLRLMIHVSRKPLFYMTSLVLPCYIICALSVTGLFARFSTRSERQERFTLGITSILSMAVLSLVVSEKVPHSSKHVPLLVQYFLFNIIVVTVATVLTSPIMRINRRGFASTVRAPPPWLHKILFVPIPTKEKYTRMKRQVSDRRRFSQCVHVPTLQYMAECVRVNVSLFIFSNLTAQVENRETDELRRHELAKAWGRVARRLDAALGSLFLFLLTTPTLYLFWMCYLKLNEAELDNFHVQHYDD